ncbi:MAG: hypothetical protein GPOALKHO_000588 [Sodalis sp.]|nr:MAG: hypothetical protein GPOALKHO_000588 [Sodalis sp.]
MGLCQPLRQRFCWRLTLCRRGMSVATRGPPCGVSQILLGIIQKELGKQQHESAKHERMINAIFYGPRLSKMTAQLNLSYLRF